jgi:hypothetical protein
MHDQAKVLEEAYATWRQLRKDRKPEEAREFLEANREKLLSYKEVADVQRNQAKFNEIIRIVQRSPSMDGDEKARRISDIRRRMDVMARRVALGYEQNPDEGHERLVRFSSSFVRKTSVRSSGMRQLISII